MTDKERKAFHDNYNMKDVQIGDKVNAMGLTVTIAKIHYQYFCDFWLIEFIDTNGKYRFWKQQYDGGEIERVTSK